jgi:hypothetical protein
MKSIETNNPVKANSISNTENSFGTKTKMSNFDDDESFYDVAEEVDSNDDLVIINNKLKRTLLKEISVFGESIDKVDDLDDDSNGYNTAMSSRHISEINSSDRLKSTQSLSMVNKSEGRRAVCAIPTNSMNKTFATFGRAFKKDRYLESIQAHFMLLPSYRRFPKDEEFKREIKVRDLYKFRSRSS